MIDAGTLHRWADKLEEISEHITGRTDVEWLDNVEDVKDLIREMRGKATDMQRAEVRA